MGLGTERFPSLPFSQQLTCTICLSVYEDPKQCPDEHIYCHECIVKWISKTPTCPMDSRPLTEQQLKPAPRFLRGIVDDLEIRCDNEESGCDEVVKLSQLKYHLLECKFSKVRSFGVQVGDSSAIEALEKNVRDLKRTLAQSEQQSAKRVKVEADAKDKDLYSNQISKLEREVIELKAQLLNSSNTIKELNEKIRLQDTNLQRIRNERQQLRDRGIVKSNLIAEQELKLASVATVSPPVTISEPKKPAINESPRDPRRQPVARETSVEIIEPSTSSSKTESTKPSSRTNDILKELYDKKDISSKLLKVLQKVDFDKFYDGEEALKDKTCQHAAMAVMNSIRRIRDTNHVLLIIECPFVAVALAEYLVSCTFVISNRIKSAIIKHGYEFLIREGRIVITDALKSNFDKFECIGSDKHGPYDVVISDWFYLSDAVRMRQLESGAKAWDAIADRVAFHKK